MRRFGKLLCAFLLFGKLANGQEQQKPEPPLLDLRLNTEKVLSESPPSLGGLGIPIRYDSKGNLYLEIFPHENAKAVPVVKYAPDGERQALFTLERAQGFNDQNAIDYSIGLRGEVAFLASRGMGDEAALFLVVFDSDGGHASVTKLDRMFTASKIAVFPGGDFLVSGTTPQNMKDTGPPRPMTLLVDRSGRTRPLSLSDDVRPETLAENKGDGSSPPRTPTQAVNLGTAIPADDGNIYLLRNAEEPFVYVIASSGEVVRRLRLDRPKGFRLITIQVAGDKIAAAFQEERAHQRGPGYPTKRRIVSLHDAQDGERLFDYEVSSELGVFACYSPTAFTFVRVNDEGRLAIQTARPR